MPLTWNSMLILNLKTARSYLKLKPSYLYNQCLLLSQSYGSQKIYTDQLMKVNYIVSATASVFIVNRKTLEHSQSV